MGESSARAHSDPTPATLLDNLCEAIAESSMLSVLLTPRTAKELELAEAYLLGGHVDGAVLVGLHGDSSLPDRLREHGIPAVLCGRRARGTVTGCVDFNDRQGATSAVEHLISLGRRKIATISGDLDTAHAIDRRMGYRDALVDVGIALDPTLEEVADYLPDRAHMAMERLLINHRDLDAVFAASDAMATAAMGVLRRAGKHIPEDVAVIGFGDSPEGAVADPPLSTIRQPLERIGREAVKLLLLEMHGPQEAPAEVVLEAELVVRESTVGAGAARAKA